MSQTSPQATETDALLHPALSTSSRGQSSLDRSYPSAMSIRREEKESGGDRSSDSDFSSLLVAKRDEDASLYDKKCVLVDHEINAMGMGKYQWSLWMLCGLGYLIDLMWAQAFGLILSPLQQELGFGNHQTGNLSVMFSVGLTTGAFAWGALVDIIGRQWAFNLTVLTASIFGLLLGVPDSYGAILVFTTITGFAIGGQIPIDTLITLEFTPESERYLLPLLSIFQPLGVVICSAIAYGFIPVYSCSPNFSEAHPLPSCSNVSPGQPCCTRSSNMGWRYLIYTLGGLTLVVFFLRSVIFRFQESPKFLLHRGQDAKAIAVLQNVANYNGTTCSLTLDQLEDVEREHASMHSETPASGEEVTQTKDTWVQNAQVELSRFKILFSTAQTTRLTILVWLTYICDYSGFTVAGMYSRLPSHVLIAHLTTQDPTSPES
jgi:MFS family permease